MSTNQTKHISIRIDIMRRCAIDVQSLNVNIIDINCLFGLFLKMYYYLSNTLV